MTVATDSDRSSYSVLEQAAEWFAVLESEQTDDAQRSEWQAWLNASEHHRKAWHEIEQINARFNGLPTQVASRTLRQPGISRRQLTKNLVILFVAGGALYQTARWQHFGASYKTGRGEIAQHTLGDGTKLWLNTASAVNIQISSSARVVELLEGEILIDTAQDTRPFYVNTAHGRLQALGTRFAVRNLGQQTKLAVEQGAVAIEDAIAGPVVIEQGFEARFNTSEVAPIARLQKNSAGWVGQIIYADGMRLDDFIEELSRHYSGYINLSPDVADLKLLGVYPTDDIDRVLAAIAQSHPVFVRRKSPWWRSIQAKKD
ncbi:MAG: FecR domain-containing protein [Pseudomonadota bacterium]